jgi:hypothetical protein
MATDKQSDANRRNAQLSTGPRTPEGRARSARNSFQHGLTAADLALYQEPHSQAAIQLRLDELFDYFDPASHQPGRERQFANELLGDAWKALNPELDRMSRYEARLRSGYDKALKQFLALCAKPPAPPAPRPNLNPSPSLCPSRPFRKV